MFAGRYNCRRRAGLWYAVSTSWTGPPTSFCVDLKMYDEALSILETTEQHIKSLPSLQHWISFRNHQNRCQSIVNQSDQRSPRDMRTV